MFPVSREKYNIAVQELTSAKELISQHEATIQNLSSSILAKEDQINILSTLATPETDQGAQVVELQSQIDSLTTSNKDYLQQIQSLTESVTAQGQTIQTLQSTIDSNDNLPAEPSALAVSSTDSPVSPVSLNDFMKQNSGDVSLCIQKLREAGL